MAAAPVKATRFRRCAGSAGHLSTVGADRTQYLKVKIVLEIADAALSPQIESTIAARDGCFQTYLRELRPTDLDGSAGLYRLKEELTRRVNTAIAPSRITRGSVPGDRGPVSPADGTIDQDALAAEWGLAHRGRAAKARQAALSENATVAPRCG